MYERVTEEELFSMKSSGVVEASPFELAQLIFDNDKYRKMWDVNHNESYLAERIADQAFIVYLRARKVAPF